ncbi:MAG: glycosyltransferase family 61 protein [Thermomicrobiales bacterium]
MFWNAWRRIDPANHQYIDFPNPAALERMLNDVLRVGIDPPQMALVEDAQFVPPDLGFPDIWSSGGIMNRRGELIPLIREKSETRETLLGLREAVPFDPVATVEEDVVYLGWLFDSFGHLMIESLARVWALKHLPASTKVVFHLWPGMEPSTSQLRILALFGIGQERIITPAEPTVFRRLIYPDPQMALFTMVHERANEPFAAVRDRIAGDAPMVDQPVYLSRRRLAANQRPVIGEAQFEDLLRDNGFLIVYPETLPIEEQIRIMATHREIVTCTGSASQLIAFARPESRFHLLCYNNYLGLHTIGSEATGTPTTYLHVLRGAMHPVSALALDIHATAHHLAAAGLLHDLHRLPSLPADLEHSPEFEEAWLFGYLHNFFTLDSPPHPTADEFIDRIRPTAWPVLAGLAARMPPDRLTDAQADVLMQSFALALGEEQNAEKLRNHAKLVPGLAALALPRCSPDTQALVASALRTAFPEHAP